QPGGQLRLVVSVRLEVRRIDAEPPLGQLADPFELGVTGYRDVVVHTCLTAERALTLSVKRVRSRCLSSLPVRVGRAAAASSRERLDRRSLGAVGFPRIRQRGGSPSSPPE